MEGALGEKEGGRWERGEGEGEDKARRRRRRVEANL